MPKFAYRVQDEEGKVLEGMLEAPSEDHAQKFLTDSHYEILDLTQHKKQWTVQGLLNRFSKVNQAGFNFFVRQLATLLKAGVPMLTAIGTLQEGIKDPVLKEAVETIYEDVEKGNSFSDSILRHPRVFNSLFVSTVKSGEAIGQLDMILSRLAELLEQDYVTQKKIRAALNYPILGTFVMIAAFFGATLFIIPRFESMFLGLGAELPLPTVLLLTTSALVRQYWYFVVAGFSLAAVGIRFHYKSFHGKRFWDGLLLKLPVIGGFMVNGIFARFTRMLGMMLQSGVNILQALEMIADIVDNSVISDAILRVHDRLREGENMAEQMQNEGVFPAVLVQIVHAGTESGRVDELLLQIAAFYDVELENMSKNMESLIEPVFLFMMGGIVLVLAIGIFLPMWNIFAAVQQSAGF